MGDEEDVASAEGAEEEAAAAPPKRSAVDDALSQIPGLAESLDRTSAARRQPAGDEADEEEGDEEAAPARPAQQDSAAVQAALDQIPGLRDSLGRE
jgi:hypothetical protein